MTVNVSDPSSYVKHLPVSEESQQYLRELWKELRTREQFQTVFSFDVALKYFPYIHALMSESDINEMQDAFSRFKVKYEEMDRKMFCEPVLQEE